MTPNIPELFLQSIKTVLKPTVNTFKRFSKKPSPSIAKTFVFLLIHNLIIAIILTGTIFLISRTDDSGYLSLFLFIAGLIYMGYFIFATILSFIFSLFIFIFSKLFGGSGSIKQLVHNIALLWIPFSTITLIINILYQFLISSEKLSRLSNPAESIIGVILLLVYLYLSYVATTASISFNNHNLRYKILSITGALESLVLLIYILNIYFYIY